MNLFDIMRNAGGGNAFATMAPQYGLSAEQMAKAVEAFMPALSAGLKRSTSDPFGLMDFMRRASTADYSRAYQNPGWAWTDGKGQGDDALAFLFGSQQAADAIAQQAAVFTGIPKQKLAELLPALAAMSFGGLASQAATMNPVLDGMLKKFRAETSDKPAAKGPLDRYEEEQDKREREDAAKAEAARAQKEMVQAGLAAFKVGTEAWQETVAAMMKGAGGGAVAGEKQSPETTASGESIFGELLEPGLRLGEAYRREMEKLVERSRSDTSRS